jgi:hypothetical protein
MRATWLWTTVLLAAVTACGEGRAVFDIDVFSFLAPSGADAVPYLGPLPPGVPDSIPPQAMNSIGIGASSLVDTVRLTGTIAFENATGTGTVTFQVFFDTLADSVYTGVPAFGATANVTPGATTVSTIAIPDVDATLKPMFLASTVYVGIKAAATPTPPSGPVQGTARLTALRARIVIQDKIF